MLRSTRSIWIRDTRAFLILCALLLNAHVVAQPCDMTTMFPRTFPTVHDAGASFSTAIGDFNGDGAADIVQGDDPRRRINLSLGDGRGGFTAPTYHWLSFDVHAIAEGDVNGDGHLDLAIGAGFNGAFLLFGNGDGTFSEATEIDFGSEATRHIAQDDVNNDGHPDLISLGAYNFDRFVSVAIGSGDGTFAKPIRVDIPDYWINFDVSDLDGDGNSDIAVLGIGLQVHVLYGTGDGAFDMGPPVPLGRPLNDEVAIADFDGDGLPDIGVSDVFGIHVVRGIGDRMFSSELELVYDGRHRSFELADVNADGDLDLLVINQELSVLLGDGDGSFAVEFICSLSQVQESIAIHDINGDGLDDIVCSDGSNSTTDLLLSRGNGAFHGERRYFIGEDPVIEAAGDVNGDGLADVLIVDGSRDVRVVFGNARREFTVGPVQSTNLLGRGYAHLASGDLDGDGRDDFVHCNSTGYTVLMSVGDGTFIEGNLLPTSQPPAHLRLVDLNGNGDLDLVIFTQTARMILFMGNGDGSFGAGSDPIYTNAYVIFPDLNGDGIADMVHASSTVGLLVSLGLPDGGWGSPVEYESVNDPRTPVARDFNGDGNLDIWVSRGTGVGPEALMYRGNGDGTLMPYTEESGPGGLGSVAHVFALDVNDDQHVDVLAIGTASTQLRAAAGNGDGTFIGGFTFDTQGNFRVSAIDDFDGDGLMDVALTTKSMVIQYGACMTACLSDLDDSGDVGFADIVMLLNTWGSCGAPPCQGDLDDDGIVGFTDLVFLLGAWGPC